MERAAQHKVTRIINPGTNIETSKAALHMSTQFTSVSAAVDMACRVLNTDLVNSMKYDLQEVRLRVNENKEG